MPKDLSSEIMGFMKSFCELVKGFSNKVVGLGACSWHSIGQELLRAYKNGDQKTIDFVNNELLKSYAEKYKDNKPDFADFKNYPEEVLEFNNIPNAEFYKAYLMFFEGDHNQNSNSFPEFISKILEAYSLNKRIADDKKDDKKNDKKYMAYKKYIFDVIFNFGENYLEINIDYDKLFKKVDELYKDEALDWEIKCSIINKINTIVSSSIDSKLTYTKIVYDFSNNWLLKDQDGYKIDPDLLKNSWQSYRIGNILGQAFREYACKQKKEHDKDNKNGKSKKSDDNTSDINKIIDGLPEIKELEIPFGMGMYLNQVNNCLSLIAQKTEKSSIVFGFEKHDKNADKNKIDTGKYYLSLIDGKTGTVKRYQIKFIGDKIHVYDMKNIPVVKLSDEESGKRLLGPEVKDLINQIKEIQKASSFCFINSPGHIEVLNHDKKDQFFNRIDKVLEFASANERSKTKDVFCRIGHIFKLLIYAFLIIGVFATVIPIIISLAIVVFEFVQKKQKEKLSQTQARLDVIENIVEIKVKTKQLKEYIDKTKTLDNKDSKKTKPNLDLSISNEQNFHLR